MRYALGAGVVSMMIAPFAWSITPVLYGSGNAAFPFAGPDLNPELRQAYTLNFSGRIAGVNTVRLEEFLKTHSQGEKFLVATPSARIASSIILNTGLPVMAYGGFLGSEKILNAERVERMVANGQVRYIMIAAASNQQPEVDAWIRAHGSQVPASEWQLPEQEKSAVGRAPAQQRNMTMLLYDCRVQSEM